MDRWWVYRFLHHVNGNVLIFEHLVKADSTYECTIVKGILAIITGMHDPSEEK